MSKSLEQVLREIDRQFGEGTVIVGTQMRGKTIERMSSGILSYDAVLGGGWPVGLWSEVIGRESMGKTLLAQSTVIANQRANPKFATLWLAGEPVNFEWCEELGMDLERVQFVPGNNLEQSYDIALKFMENRLCDLIIIDSLPAMIPTSESDRDFEELSIGRAALMNNKFFVRRAPTAMRRSLTEADRPCTGLVVNQWRERIGVMHGDPRTTPGGMGKNFTYYVRCEMTRTEFIKEGKKVVGGRFRIRTLKNKAAPVNRAAEVNFYFDDAADFAKGTFDHIEDIVATAMYYDLFGTGGGGNYHFGENRWRGRERVVQAVREDLDLREEIRAAVIKTVNPAVQRKLKLVRKR